MRTWVKWWRAVYRRSWGRTGYWKSWLGAHRLSEGLGLLVGELEELVAHRLKEDLEAPHRPPDDRVQRPSSL